MAGGSSSGSGVAVAAGLAPGALGSDTGGSIRIPASLCGITGLKPTYGRVSRAGVLPLAWSMDHVGPMTRTAADCALMLGAMAGYDPADPSTQRAAGARLHGRAHRRRQGAARGAPARLLPGRRRARRCGRPSRRRPRRWPRAGAVVDEVSLEQMTRRGGGLDRPSSAPRRSPTTPSCCARARPSTIRRSPGACG